MLLKNTQLERMKSIEPLWGHWTIGKLIGDGSFGSVYEAIDQKRIEPNAALKIMTVEFESQEELWRCGNPDKYLMEKLEHTLSEIRRMVRLRDYPNFVTYHEFDYFGIRDQNGRLHGYDVLIRMEKLRSLTEYFMDRYGNNRKATEADVLRLGIDICTGLRDAGRGAAFMHRDIKPQNIFVSGSGVYKLGDLGISGMNQSLRGTVCGTPLYMAPEIWMGRGYHADVDLYALGLVMYELLSGNLPFGNSPDGMAMRLGGKAIPRLTSVSSGLADIVARAVAFEPHKRWQTASDMLTALQNCTKKPEQTKKTVTAQKTVTPQKSSANSKQNNNHYISNKILAKHFGFVYGYEGEARNGVAHGKGKYTFVDGAVLEGNWVNGKAQGRCKYTDYNGDVYIGEYKNGQRDGAGTFMYANGNIETGKYVNGKWCPDDNLDDIFDEYYAEYYGEDR